MQHIMAGIQQATNTKLIWASDYCRDANHIPQHVKPKAPDMENQDWDAIEAYQQEMQQLRERYKVQKMVIGGQVVCPRCGCDAESQKLQQEIEQQALQQKAKEKTLVLYNQSILQDEGLAVARFDNYRTEGEPVAYQNLMQMQDYAKDILNGQTFNILLYGPPGVGKSHLSYSLLHYINVHSQHRLSCLFVDIDEMLRRLRDSFDNPSSKYTEFYFTRLLSEVDVLVLDDLGAETGNEETKKQASDFTGRILRAVANSRQGKVTAVTTNLGGEQLNRMYDGKTLSRLSKNRKVVLFSGIQDKRPLEGY